MTSIINARSNPATNTNRLTGFTLLELMVSIGIIGLLAAILLPGLTKLWDRSLRLRTQADFQAIATALEAYKSDFNGYYPPVATPNTGAAVLGKALIGAGDAAHYWTMNTAVTPPQMVADPTLQNAPDPTANAYDAGHSYQPGDLVRSGGMPTFDEYVAGQNVGIWICLRANGPAAPHMPTIGGVKMDGTGTEYWWVPFLPYDGADGPGSRIRLAAANLDASGNDIGPHAPAGKVYGPYLDSERFKTRGPVLLDHWSNPILYFPVNKNAKATLNGATLAVPTTGGGFINRMSYPRNVTQTLAMVNPNDNLAMFCNELSTKENPPAAASGNILAARIQLMLGDYNINGIHEPTGAGASPVGEPTPPTTPFLLWSAGKDGIFGPRGESDPMDYSLKNQDFYTGNSNASENAATAAAVDDVTNFR